nr:MAG TPA: Head Tail Connector Protein [Caudoviricetes sp.]
MLYCDYDAYRSLGGQAEESEITHWLLRASRKIDQLTYGRAERHAEDLTEVLADACAQIADAMRTGSEARDGGMRGLASVSNDGVSESYSAYGDAMKAQEREYYRILRDALGMDEYGLLYVGVYPC